MSVVAAVSAVVLGATTAFYSDTETSTGNTFTAGAIDLTVDNESYAIDCNLALDALYPPKPPCRAALVARPAAHARGSAVVDRPPVRRARRGDPRLRGTVA